MRGEDSGKRHSRSGTSWPSARAIETVVNFGGEYEQRTAD
jgi:hypothetical protein